MDLMMPGGGGSKKKMVGGNFGYEAENDTSDLFASAMFPPQRPDKDIMGSASPQFNSAHFNSSIYGQQTSAIGGFGLQQVPRGLPNPQPPSSNFNLSLSNQQPNSPIRSFDFSSTQPPVGGLSAFGSSRPQVFGAQGLQTTSQIVPSSSSEVPSSLDLAEFPALTNRNTGSNASSTMMSGRPAYVGMVSKPSEQPSEFHIQNEDFPALPGTQTTMKHNQSQHNLPLSGMTANLLGGDKSKEQSTGDDKSQLKPGIQTYPDGRVTNIPGAMVTDQFGIVGLLTFIRAAESDPNLVALALGSDLTALGLNLNAYDNLYTTFQSPFSDKPCRPQDIDFHVPSEYLTNVHIRDKLAQIKLNRYGEDLLFYLFYTNGGDVLQLAAAAELYNRDWRYHKDERVWITRAPGMEPQLKTNTYERGTYYFFDWQSWRKVAKEFHLEYDKLEERPQLPNTANYHPAQQQMSY